MFKHKVAIKKAMQSVLSQYIKKNIDISFASENVCTLKKKSS